MMETLRILVIDDDPMVRRSCERVLGERYSVVCAEDGESGLAALADRSFHLALVDLKLPDISGMDILRQAPDRFPDLPIIVITGYTTIQSAVEAIKAGAVDYVAKPFSPAELEAAVEKALRHRRLLEDYHLLQGTLTDRYDVKRLVGRSPAMKRVYALIGQVSDTDATVLLTGESGTGKELVARAIHFSGPRKSRRFVAVDCGAIPGGLISSELFGHVRGAFTGAVDDRAGLVQSAEGGTLFLDEIGNLALDLQATLLRLIETRAVRPVGASEGLPVDVRIIAASNQDLQDLVAKGRFRTDLFYRLNVFPIHLPPLRERREDVPLLLRYFLDIFSKRLHKRIAEITPEAINALVQYDWPGNVRELSNVVERLVILCLEGRVGRAHVQDSLTVGAVNGTVPRTADQLNALKREARDRVVADVERAFLLEALRRNDFNVSRAADQTGMQRTHFQALLRKHRLRIRDLAAGGAADAPDEGPTESGRS